MTQYPVEIEFAIDGIELTKITRREPQLERLAVK